MKIGDVQNKSKYKSALYIKGFFKSYIDHLNTRR